MSTPTEQDYSAGNKLIAGIVFTEQENLAADTYYNGMPLAYEAETGVYAYSATQFDAFYNGATKTLASAGHGSIIVGGELYEGGMVTDANVVITMTTALRAQMRANGFYPRKVK